MKRAVFASITVLAAAAAAFAECGTYEHQLAHTFVKQHVREQLGSPTKADFPFRPSQKALKHAGSKCLVSLKWTWKLLQLSCWVSPEAASFLRNRTFHS